ncbi:MAG: sn-glycerol-1-phosphate dehydrogenase [Bacteroidales bacterium]
MNRVENALKAANETRALILGKGVLKEIGNLFREQFPGKKGVVIADRTTWKIAGQYVTDILIENGLSHQPPFIFDDPDLYAAYGYVDQLVDFLEFQDAIPVAVGSGTINDLTKLAAFRCGRPYMVVGTAASMDGYTAFGASITHQGAKQTFNCPAPQAMIADTDIIGKAPSEMTASGYADLFAKVTAGADWLVAHYQGVELVEEKAWSIVQDGLKDALADPLGAAAGKQPAIERLTEGLLLGGFAMQWSKSSRPASGAEHQFSHLWNMEHHTNNGEHISHGFQVSLGMLAISAFYEQVLKTPLDKLDIEACVAAWPSKEEVAREARLLFKDTDFPEIGVQETAAKYPSEEELRRQLTALKENWPVLKEALKKQLLPYKEVKSRLKKVGAPTEPEEIGLTRARLRDTFIRSQFIRRRYTVLDLAVRTGNMDKWLEPLFGKKGIWEIEISQ